MSYKSVITCLWIISGTLLTNGLPQSPSAANGPQSVLPIPESKVDETRNGSITYVNGIHQSSSSSDSNSSKAYPDGIAEKPAIDGDGPITVKPTTSTSTEISTSSKSPATTVATNPTTKTPETTSSEAPQTTTPSTTPSTTTATTTTTTASTTPSTTSVKPTSITPTSTKAPTPTTTSAPESGRRFDGLSFIGGMVLAAGFTAIGFIAWKFYKARTERNYHTL